MFPSSLKLKIEIFLPATPSLDSAADDDDTLCSVLLALFIDDEDFSHLFIQSHISICLFL